LVSVPATTFVSLPAAAFASLPVTGLVPDSEVTAAPKPDAIFSRDEN